MNTFQIPTEEAMQHFGKQLATHTQLGTVIFLKGDLGAGKTTLVRGFLRAKSYKGHVKSPTYTLVEHYHLHQQDIYHFDLYRLKDPEELHYLGIEDYFKATSICLIEWPEQANEQLPKPDLTCYIETNATGRLITLEAQSQKGANLMANLTPLDD